MKTAPSNFLATLIAAGFLGALSLTLTAKAAGATAMLEPAPSNVSPTATSSIQYLRDYRDERWHFSITIPNDTTTDASSAQGGETIQFLDPDGHVQFQISAWPYQQIDVHANNLIPQPPSEHSDQQIKLGSIGIIQGDTTEFLFHKSGITYDVETLPQNATSTLDVLKSWQFI